MTDLCGTMHSMHNAALAVAEFTDMQFETSRSWFGLKKLRDITRLGGVALVKNGEEVLDALGLKGIRYTQVMQHMALLSFINFGLCFAALHFSDKHLVGRLKRRFRTNYFSAATTTDEEEYPVAESRYDRGMEADKLSQSKSRRGKKQNSTPFRLKF